MAMKCLVPKQVYGGAPLQKAAGDYLANEGVGIYTLYGL